MAGQIKELIDKIIVERSKGNSVAVSLVRAKMAMKGVIPDMYTSSSTDDPIIIEKLQNLARELNINL